MSGERSTPLRTTPEQVERRRDAAVRLRRQGYSREQVADALDVSVSTVTADTRARGAQDAQVGVVPPTTPPERIDWMSKPVPPPPTYRNSLTLQLWHDVVVHSSEINAASKFVWDVTNADDQHDRAWLNEAENTIRDAYAYLARLHRVLNDRDYRRDALHGIERDDLRGLRVVRE